MLYLLQNRKTTILVVAVVLLLVSAFVTRLSRTYLVTDLGTGGRISVRFNASSPLLSGTKAFVQLSSLESKSTEGVICSLTTFYRNNIPVHKGVSIILKSNPGKETSVGELIEIFDQSIDREDFPVPVLESGDPNTPIGANYKEPQRIYFSPDWSVFQFFDSKVWFPVF